MRACATSDTDNNTLYTINTLHDKRAPHATATLSYRYDQLNNYDKIGINHNACVIGICLQRVAIKLKNKHIYFFHDV